MVCCITASWVCEYRWLVPPNLMFLCEVLIADRDGCKVFLRLNNVAEQLIGQ